VRLSDFKTNEYANLIGGKPYEPAEENPMIGFRGASRYYNSRYQDAFALECCAMKKVRDEMGLTNLKLMVPFCRTVEEGRKVVAEMAKHGLVQGQDGLEIYVMCEIPSNVILADEFAEVFDGFSIGSNDLTQLILGVDRDSEIVADIFDERNPAVKKMIASVIRDARGKGRKIGICGQAPSDYPEFAQFLVWEGIDSISLNPDTVMKTTLAILETLSKQKDVAMGSMAVCPVCHQQVDDDDATEQGLAIEYHGIYYYFDSHRCWERFDNTPWQYATHRNGHAQKAHAPSAKVEQLAGDR
jgi:pyruvate,water dikinase